EAVASAEQVVPARHGRVRPAIEAVEKRRLGRQPIQVGRVNERLARVSGPRPGWRETVRGHVVATQRVVEKHHHVRHASFPPFSRSRLNVDKRAAEWYRYAVAPEGRPWLSPSPRPVPARSPGTLASSAPRRRSRPRRHSGATCSFYPGPSASSSSGSARSSPRSPSRSSSTT